MSLLLNKCLTLPFETSGSLPLCFNQFFSEEKTAGHSRLMPENNLKNNDLLIREKIDFFLWLKNVYHDMI
jgi:hypothetical protein